MKKMFLFLITFYQTAFPLRGNCRFYPTCSMYTKESIEKYGVLKGISMGIKRLLSCHPFGKNSPHMVK